MRTDSALSLTGSVRILRLAERADMPEQIAIGDGTYYANYKEPFRQLEGAIPGYPLGELPYDVESKLLCPYCQPERTYHNVGSHIAKKHGLTSDEFKTEAGLNQGTALVSEQTRLRNSAAAIKREFGKGGGGAFSSEDAAKGGQLGGKGRRTARALNARGCCFDQVLATARRVKREKGRVTETLLRKEGINERIVAMHFGSWEAFLVRLGEDPQRSGVRRKDTDLMIDLRSVAEALGHTPTVSDMRRYQMATRGTYEKHFGSWAKACKKAGIEPNVPSMWLTRAPSAEEDGAVLAAYAVTGSYAKAAARLSMSGERAIGILMRYGIGPVNGNTVNSGLRRRQMELAAKISRRIAGWPDEVAS